MQFFDWLYRRNPAGPAAVWLASTQTDGSTLGIAAAFPRHIYASGRCETAYVLGDFCVDAAYRSLGLAVALQRACLAGLWAAGTRMAVDFPSDRMLTVYRRLGIESQESMIRYATPLRVDRKVAGKVRVAVLGRAVGAIANAGLALRNGRLRRQTACTITAEPGPWGAEFTAAAYEWRPQAGNCVARTAEYLNWRYGEHPTRKYQVLTARESGKLRGYLVQHKEHGSCSIDDLMGKDDAVRRDLLIECIAQARRSGMETLSAPWLASHSGQELLRQCGFRPRESRPVVVLSAPGTGDAGGWYISFGDWES
jgi:GNAT superfamily N-acetyltransferase